MLSLVYWPDPILKKVAQPVTEFDEELKKNVADMFDIMHKNNGIGLAATQVGLLKRIFVTEIDGSAITFINPEIVEFDGELEIEEGCLSFPGIQIKKIRKRMITIRSQRTDGVLFKMSIAGLASICFQHELDHLSGITFIDDLSKLKRDMIMKKMKKWRKKNG